MEFEGSFFSAKSRKKIDFQEADFLPPKKNQGDFQKFFKNYFSKKKKKIISKSFPRGLIFYLGAKIHVLKIDFPPAFCRKKKFHECF